MLTKSPMGWNSWDCYGPSVTEDIVRANAQVMAEKLRPFGWEYIVVDIQWYQPTAGSHDYVPFADLTMDEYGRLMPAVNRFPSAADGAGFRPLADYVHSLGLKFGIHIMRGIPRQAVHQNTKILGSDRNAREIAKRDSICVWNTDMYGVDPAKEGAEAYYRSLFDLYASWGVDFIKCDDICRELPHEQEELVLLSKCLQDCGREMVLSLSPGPALLDKAALYAEVAQMWRITDDFWDQWELLYAMFERCEKWSIHTQTGCYPDADMLPVGALRQNADKNDRTHFTEDEQKTMMTLFGIFRSPLMIGGDLAKLDAFTEKLLTNQALLTMHDRARHAHQVWRKEVYGSETVLWGAIHADGGDRQYAAVFNLSDAENTFRIPGEELACIGSPVTVLDLWSGTEQPFDRAEGLTVTLPPHGCAAWLISP